MLISWLYIFKFYFLEFLGHFPFKVAQIRGVLHFLGGAGMFMDFFVYARRGCTPPF